MRRETITRKAIRLCFLLLLADCQEHEPEPLTFRYHLPSELTALDPARIIDRYSSGVADRIFDGLMRLDRVRQVPEPEIAESYSVSENGLVYDFRLRRDVRFHNGRSVLASDFKYSWERLLANETSGQQAWLLEVIEGAAAFRAGESESVSGIEATNPDLLRIRLTEPFGPFLYHLADPALSVVPREEVERLGERFGHQPVGSGPYRFVEAVRDFRIVLTAFADHARHQPQVKRLVYEVVPNETGALRLFRSGRLDLVTRLPPGSDQELQRSLSAELRIFPGLSAWEGFCFRCDQAPFDDPRVRRAFSLAIDRDALVRELGELDRVRNEPVTELVESYSKSEDGRVYDFQLARGARFHNDRPIRAGDFKYSWERVLTPETDSRRAWLFELIEGADAFRRGEAESVSGIEVVGSHRLRVRLKAPFAPFLYHLADPAAAVVPEEEVRRLGHDFGRRPVGSGPYRFVGWKDNARLELAAFHGHVHHSPQVERLFYEIVPDSDEALRRYQAGELDLVSRIPPGRLRSLQQTFSSDLYIFPGSFWYGFCFRCDQRPFDDPRVRRAFSLAVDRDAVVRELGELQYTAAVGFLPQGIPGHIPATVTHEHDLERARTLLAEAGYPGGKGFPKQVYPTRTGEIYERTAKLLVDAFSRLGIPADYRVMAFGSLVEARNEGRLPLFFRNWGGEYPDPEPYFRPVFPRPSRFSYILKNEPSFDYV